MKHLLRLVMISCAWIAAFIFMALSIHAAIIDAPVLILRAVMPTVITIMFFGVAAGALK